MASEPRIGLVVFAHGSRIAEANDAVRRVAERAAARCDIPLWEAAFLELADPTLASSVALLSEKGANKIIVTPYFLTMGIHLQRDLPALLREIAAQRPGLDLTHSPPLDGHPALVDILADRARELLRS